MNEEIKELHTAHRVLMFLAARSTVDGDSLRRALRLCYEGVGQILHAEQSHKIADPAAILGTHADEARRCFVEAMVILDGGPYYAGDDAEGLTALRASLDASLRVQPATIDGETAECRR